MLTEKLLEAQQLVIKITRKILRHINNLFTYTRNFVVLLRFSKHNKTRNFLNTKKLKVIIFYF